MRRRPCHIAVDLGGGEPAAMLASRSGPAQAARRVQPVGKPGSPWHGPWRSCGSCARCSWFRRRPAAATGLGVQVAEALGEVAMPWRRPAGAGLRQRASSGGQARSANCWKAGRVHGHVFPVVVCRRLSLIKANRPFAGNEGQPGMSPEHVTNHRGAGIARGCSQCTPSSPENACQACTLWGLATPLPTRGWFVTRNTRPCPRRYKVTRRPPSRRFCKLTSPPWLWAMLRAMPRPRP